MKHLKQEFDKLTFKETIVYVLAVCTNAAAFVLLFIGLFIPPEGEIHESVLTAYGISLLFVGSLLGISMHYGSELTRFKNMITDFIDDNKSKEPITDKGDENIDR